jgi:hypothetical protein
MCLFDGAKGNTGGVRKISWSREPQQRAIHDCWKVHAHAMTAASLAVHRFIMRRTWTLDILLECILATR